MSCRCIISENWFEFIDLGRECNYKEFKKWKKYGSLREVVINVLGCNFVMSEFELQSHYYVVFWYNNIGKVKNPLSSPIWFKLYNNFSFKRIV